MQRINILNQQQLDLTNSAAIAPSPSTFDLRKIDLKKMGRSLIQFFNLSTELQVWQASNEPSESSWSAYDPETKQSIHHISEQQMRVWLEQRNRS